jgi:NAD(P)-dependent dehydrogenase (short-subunit alcohol dehydrogenase family)
MPDTDRAAIVTGGASGIGRATSRRLAALGMAVLVVDRDADGGQGTVDEIAAAGGTASFFEADVSDPEAVRGYVEACESRHGRIDAFLNNAAYGGVMTPTTDYDLADFDRVFAVNVRGAFLGLQHVLPVMKRQGGGAIVNVASRAGVRGLPTQAPYSASKHAVIGLSRSVALEVAADGVRVNAICPGPVDTPMTTEVEDIIRDQGGNPELFLNMVPVGRYADPDEIAALAAWLLGEAPGFLTGAVVLIDGGISAG